jgi:hypothetical protein
VGTLLGKVEGMGVHILACKEVGRGVGMACKVVVGMALRMAEGMGYMAERVVRMAVGMGHMAEGMVRMAEDMVDKANRIGRIVEDMVHIVEDVVRIVEDMVRMVEGMVRMVEGNIVEDIALHMARIEEDNPNCKVLGKQACMVLGSKRVGKARKLEGMVHNNRHRNCWNSLSTRVPRHPKKATRLIFPVVFSLKDSLC